MEYIITKKFLSKLKEFLNFSENILIISHQNPDGDAISSSLGLLHFLKKKYKNKKINIIVPNNFHHFLKWLKKSNEIIIFSENETYSIELIKKANLIFCLDFNSMLRTGDLENLIISSKAKKVLIDHHPSPEIEQFDLILSKESASSASEVLYNFIEILGEKKLIDKNIAECIFTGISSDTNSFSVNSNSLTHKIVAEILEIGVDKEKVQKNLFHSFSFNKMKLMAYVLSEKMKIFPKYNLGLISLNAEEKEKFNFEVGDADNFANLPMSIKDIEISAFFTNYKDFIKISFRSMGSFNTNLFARKYFNGGGHKKASGGKSYKNMEETIEDFLFYIKEFLKN